MRNGVLKGEVRMTKKANYVLLRIALVGYESLRMLLSLKT